MTVTMRTTALVKICGLKTVETMAAALNGGADFVGLVFFPPSPRTLDLALAKPLADQARGRAKVVALTVDPSDALVDAIAAEIRPDIIQLHGSETVERGRAIHERSGTSVMKAVKIAEPTDVDVAFAFAAPNGPCDMILFDAKAPRDSLLPGGNGLTFDWRALDGVNDRLDYMLSGGLTAENVRQAVRLTGAFAVDVSSGVEIEPGIKDPNRIAAFLKAAKAG